MRLLAVRLPISHIIMNIQNTELEIIEEFADLTDWMDRYAYIIDLGNTLPEYPESEKTPSNLIEGCQSRVWIAAKLDDNGKVHFQADSDALIVKGIVALLMRVFDDRSPREILEADLTFIDKIGLSEHLSPTRSNGLRAMVKEIKNYARAFEAMQKVQ